MYLYPVLLHLCQFKLNSYGLLAALAVIAAGFVVQRVAGRLGVDPGV